MVTFCVMDMRPFEIVHGNGFMNLIQGTLDMAYINKHCLCINDVLPSAQTIRNIVFEHARH